MIPSTPSISPLRQRMLEDMRMRKLEPRTQEAYIRAVRKLAAYLKRSPDAATVEDLRNFQLHLVDTGSSPMTLNATLTGLKFFFDITLGRIELMAKMQPVKLPRTLPVALKRALSARKYLVDRGVSPLKIMVNFASAADYVTENITPEGRYQNQRVEIELIYVPMF